MLMMFRFHFDNDNNQSTVVLMTGVGTEETGKDRHRYSLYKFSLIRNIFAIKVRAALTGGKFENDNSFGHFPHVTYYLWFGNSIRPFCIFKQKKIKINSIGIDEGCC